MTRPLLHLLPHSPHVFGSLFADKLWRFKLELGLLDEQADGSHRSPPFSENQTHYRVLPTHSCPPEVGLAFTVPFSLVYLFLRFSWGSGKLVNKSSVASVYLG